MECLYCLIALVYLMTKCPVLSVSIDIHLINDTGRITGTTFSRYNLILDKPFDINVINSMHDGKFYQIPWKITCTNANLRAGSNELPYVELKFNEVKNYTYSVTVQKATSEMNSKWRCVIDTFSFNLTFNLHDFEVQVKPITIDPEDNEPVITMMVNNVNIIPNKQKLEDNNILIGDYMYQEGELAKIACKTQNKAHIRITFLSYFSDTNFGIIKTQYIIDEPEQTLFLKLTDKHNSTYLACHVKTRNTSHKYTFQLYFIKQPPNSNDDCPKFQINGLSLAPSNKSAILNYLYVYNDEENLIISGSTNSMDVVWSCFSGNDYDPKSLKAIQNQKTGIYVQVLIVKDTYLTCQVGSYNLSLMLVHAAIPFHFCPVISGLSSANTLMKYRDTQTTYQILYRNPGDKELRLTCYNANNTKCWWNYTDTEVMATQNKFKRSTKDKYEVNLSLKLLRNVSNTDVKCVCFFKNMKKNVETTTVIKIIKKYHNGRIQEAVTSTSEVTDPRLRVTKQTETPFTIGSLLAIIAVILVVVILVTWIIVRFYKMNKKLQQMQNPGIISTPQPLNAYSVPADNEEHTYSEPVYIPNTGLKKRLVPNNAHPEIGQSAESDYSAVEAQGYVYDYARVPQPMYSQAQPKSLRGKPQDIGPNVPDTMNYAQVAPKSQRNIPNESKYANLFEKEQYSNAH